MTETGKFSFAKGAGGNWPYNKAAGKMQYFAITDISLTLPPFGTGEVIVTCQDLDKDGRTIGPEHSFRKEGYSSRLFLNELIGSYGDDGDSYRRTGNIAAVYFRAYAGSGRLLATASVMVAEGGGVPVTTAPTAKEKGRTTR